jgi:hypothetical protein
MGLDKRPLSRCLSKNVFKSSPSRDIEVASKKSRQALVHRTIFRGQFNPNEDATSSQNRTSYLGASSKRDLQCASWS